MDLTKSGTATEWPKKIIYTIEVERVGGRRVHFPHFVKLGNQLVTMVRAVLGSLGYEVKLTSDVRYIYEAARTSLDDPGELGGSDTEDAEESGESEAS
jgi:hypothetical protein